MDDAAVNLESTPSVLKINLTDLIGFLNWLQQAQKAFEKGDALPAAPGLESESAKSWIDLFCKLEGRYRLGEEKQMSLEANLQSQEAEVAEVLSRLYVNIASLYENLGQDLKAQELRRKASVVQSHEAPLPTQPMFPTPRRL